MPTSPTNLKVSAENEGELRISWDPPSRPRGNVTHYQLYWQKRDLDPAGYEARDYCSHRMYLHFYPFTALCRTVEFTSKKLWWLQHRLSKTGFNPLIVFTAFIYCISRHVFTVFVYFVLMQTFLPVKLSKHTNNVYYKTGSANLWIYVCERQKMSDP